MRQLVLIFILLAGCATMPHKAREMDPLDPMKVVAGLTTAVHYHMLHGRVPSETWDTAEALQRGVGLCSQQAMALHGLLKMFGLQSRVLGLDGHVICIVLVDYRWIVADPDYGVVVPIAIEELEKDPMLAVPYYGREMPVFDKAGNHFYN